MNHESYIAMQNKLMGHSEQGCPRNEINSCRRRIVVDQQTTTVIVDEFFFRHPVEIVVDKGKNSIKLSIGVVDENTIPQNVR